ncbi:MAG TPA: hypothetical protein PKD55_17945 [Bellilinea sp.]|nr:hypothetical protein [Bellilinea sp.]
MRNEQEPRPAPITFEQVSHFAQEALLRNGHHAPTLIIDGSARPVVVQIDGLAPTFEGRVQQMFVAGQAVARDGSAGRLRSVYFVSEAWLSQAQEGKLPDMSPSQDPQRKEVLIVDGVEIKPRRTRVAIYGMLRDEQGNLREIHELKLPDETSTSSDNPLLEAFLTGFWARDGLR